MKRYSQTTNFTCGPSCLLMVLNHFNGTESSVDNELALSQKVRLYPFYYSCVFRMAKVLEDRGLKVKLVKGSSRFSMPRAPMFENINPTRLAIAEKVYELHKKEAEKRIKIEYRTPTKEEIINHLCAGNIIIAKINSIPIGGTHMHCIVLTDLKNNEIYYEDPDDTIPFRQTMSLDSLAECLNTEKTQGTDSAIIIILPRESFNKNKSEVVSDG